MNRSLPSTQEALNILQKTGCSPEVIRHCKAVARQAVHIANMCTESGVNINIQLIHIGALLHDLGRSRTHSIDHVVIGADIAQTLNLPEPIISIIERHVGGGITAEEANNLGWPKKNFMPETLEEKIVTYADKLIEGSKVVPIQETMEKLEKELGTAHPAPKRVLDLHIEMSELCKLGSRGRGTPFHKRPSNAKALPSQGEY